VSLWQGWNKTLIDKVFRMIEMAKSNTGNPAIDKIYTSVYD
jgi:hypothetical protein